MVAIHSSLSAADFARTSNDWKGREAEEICAIKQKGKQGRRLWCERCKKEQTAMHRGVAVVEGAAPPSQEDNVDGTHLWVGVDGEAKVILVLRLGAIVAIQYDAAVVIVRLALVSLRVEGEDG